MRSFQDTVRNAAEQNFFNATRAMRPHDNKPDTVFRFCKIDNAIGRIAGKNLTSACGTDVV